MVKTSEDKLILDSNGKNLKFARVNLKFNKGNYENVFSEKNNKTLKETIKHIKYQNLSKIIEENYSEFKDNCLGDFLLKLKKEGDNNYQLFLNRYGDLNYSIFWIDDYRFLNKKGLYCYVIGDEVKYIGRSLDSFKKRINQGYGKIHPKNCYKDGQATNCRLNSLITINNGIVSLFICPIGNNDEIIELENNLIKLYNPDWNIASVSSYDKVKQIKILGENKMVKVRGDENSMAQNEKFTEIWNRIVENVGERFFTKTGKPFTYEINGSMFIPSRTEYAISRADISKAYKLVPISGPGQISQLVRGPSYLWAVLHDERISKGEW